jgi:hypothetical protein
MSITTESQLQPHLNAFSIEALTLIEIAVLDCDSSDIYETRLFMLKNLNTLIKQDTIPLAKISIMIKSLCNLLESFGVLLDASNVKYESLQPH